ncbi:MAG: hypothetical protein K8R68_04120 [Bacteroidales bacterium]|nr:hypothetical protein [Bacteroidales bacterium]
MAGDNNNWRNKFGTNFNFQQPSFIDGLRSGFNIFGNHYPNNLHSDSMSLKNDWETIGNDFRMTFDKSHIDPNSPFNNKMF